jgi:hypothetical protein
MERAIYLRLRINAYSSEGFEQSESFYGPDFVPQPNLFPMIQNLRIDRRVRYK